MKTSNESGLFVVNYQIGTGEMGAVNLALNLAVSTVEKTVSGTGLITQAVNPPVHVETDVKGSYITTYLMDVPQYIVTSTGYPNIHMPPHSGIGPVLLPNSHFTLMLNDDWQSGTANYKYKLNSFDVQEKWIEVENVPVKAVSVTNLKAA